MHMMEQSIAKETKANPSTAKRGTAEETKAKYDGMSASLVMAWVLVLS